MGCRNLAARSCSLHCTLNPWDHDYGLQVRDFPWDLVSGLQESLQHGLRRLRMVFGFSLGAVEDEPLEGRGRADSLQCVRIPVGALASDQMVEGGTQGK